MKYYFGANVMSSVLYIKDVVTGILSALEMSNPGRNLEVSNTSLISLGHLSQLVENLIGERLNIEWEVTSNYSVNLGKHINRFPTPIGWNPAYDIGKGLKELIELNEKSAG